MQSYNLGVKKAVAIVALPSFGGSGILATELGLALAKRGWEVHFISSSLPVRLSMVSDGTLPSSLIHIHQVIASSYPVFAYQPYTLALAGRIAEVVKEFQIPIVHAHYAIPHSISAVLARQALRSNVKVITTLHGTDITILGVDSGLRVMTELALEESNAVTAVSNWLLGETRKQFSFQGPIEVIYNFVNPALFHPNPGDVKPIRQRYVPPNGALFIHVSNFRPVKRASKVIEIFNGILKEHPAHLLMVGEGPDHANTVKLVDDLGLGDRVSFLDCVLNLPLYLASADIFLMPSLSESFGLAALESMACGTPVIASRVGGLPEVIDDGVDGILCDPEDIDGMVGSALSLIQNKAKLEEMGRNASAKPANRFNYERLVSKYEELYLSLL